MKSNSSNTSISNASSTTNTLSIILFKQIHSFSMILNKFLKNNKKIKIITLNS